MRASVEPLEGNKVKVTVEVDEREFSKAVDAAARKLAQSARVPGFRPGKVPRRLLEARLGTDTLRQEALRESVPEYYAQALKDTALDVIAPPEIDITSPGDDGSVTFDAVVEVRPQISVPGYAGLRVSIPSPLVTDDDVETQIDRLRAPFAELRPVLRPAATGDHVTIDLRAYHHDQAIDDLSADDLVYEVGSGRLVPGLDDQLRGAKAGDIFKFNAPVSTELVADGEAAFQVLVKDVKEKVLPDLTDEWASDSSEFETVEELRADLRTRIAELKKVQSQLAFRDEAVRALAELVADEVPEPLVNEEMRHRLEDLVSRFSQQNVGIEQYLTASGQTQEDLFAEVRAGAVEAVKADLALRAVADAEEIEATDDDVDAQIARLAERIGQRPDQVRRQLDRADRIPAVRSDIRKTRALRWLLEHVEVVDEEGRPIDRTDLVPDLPDTDGPEPGGMEG